MVHGLLTAMLPTELGGTLNFIAREMVFEFVRPVFTGDTVRCEATITAIEPADGRVNGAVAGACRNQHGKDVLRFRSRGVILTAAAR